MNPVKINAMTPLQAAEANPIQALHIKNVVAMARRLGHAMPVDKAVDLFQLDKDIAGASIEDRMHLKTMLRHLGLL